MKLKHQTFAGIKWIISCLILVILVACGDTPKRDPAIDNISVDLKISRFDADFAAAGPEDLPVLKKKYPYLFPAQYPDSVWVAKMKDTLQQELLDEVLMEFPDFESEQMALEDLYRHIKYYFPDQELPKVITMTSDVAYKYRVIWADSLLLLGMDNYLGSDHRFYKGFQRYVAFGLDKRFLTEDVASAFARQVVPAPADRTFLARMLYYGKQLYLKSLLLPDNSDALHMGYSEADIAWAQANEEQMWRYFVERELLYSTDQKLEQRFLDPAPFSKFGLELDNESPGRIGRYLGWQIVKTYADKNPVPLQTLLQMPAEEIFKQANYKPRR